MYVEINSSHVCENQISSRVHSESIAFQIYNYNYIYILLLYIIIGKVNVSGWSSMSFTGG